MTDEKIAEILEYEAKATPGPWEADTLATKIFANHMNVADIRGWGYLTGIGGLRLSDEAAFEIQKANGQFIARARTDLPEAMREIQRLRKQLTSLLPVLISALQSCGCSLRERDSGHRTDCWTIQEGAQEIIDAAKESAK